MKYITLYFHNIERPCLHFFNLKKWPKYVICQGVLKHACNGRLYKLLGCVARVTVTKNFHDQNILGTKSLRLILFWYFSQVNLIMPELASQCELINSANYSKFLRRTLTGDTLHHVNIRCLLYSASISTTSTTPCYCSFITP